VYDQSLQAITCGAWSEGGLLALGSEDRSMSISNIDGDTLRVATLRAEPMDIQVKLYAGITLSILSIYVSGQV
jgi:hypothetical protein